MKDDLAESNGLAFLNDTRLTRSSVRNARRPAIEGTSLFKSYPDAQKVSLPRASWELSEARIIRLLQQRRSVRRYSREPISAKNLAFLLWASQGVTARAGNHLLRTSPSAGALYPLETYISVQNAVDIPSGIYHFDVRAFQLELLTVGDLGKRIASAFLEQSFLEQAAVCFFWSVVFRRSLTKYGDRGIRYLLLDAAHACQNTLLATEAIGCGGCPVAAFFDEEINSLLGLDGIEETVLYAASIGKK